MRGADKLLSAFPGVAIVVFFMTQYPVPAGDGEPESIVLDLGLGAATPRQIGVDQYSGEIVIIADEGFNAVDETEWVSTQRPIVVARVPMIRKRDGTWEPGYAKSATCNDPQCRALNLERGQVDDRGSQICAVIGAEGERRSVLLDVRSSVFFRSWLTSSPGALACGVLPGRRKVATLTAAGLVLESAIPDGVSDEPIVWPWPSATGAAVAGPVRPSPSGDWVAVGSGRTVAVMTAEDPRSSRVMSTMVHPVTQVAWSSDGQRLAAGSRGGEVEVWSASSGSSLFRRVMHGKKAITGLAFDPRGEVVLTTGADESLRLTTIGDGLERMTYKSRQGLRGVVLHPDSGAVATLSSASAGTKLGLGTTGVSLHVLLPQDNPALAAVLKPEPLGPIPGLGPEASAWARMRLCSKVIDSAEKARARAAQAADSSTSALVRKEFETSEEFSARQAQVRENAVRMQIGEKLVNDEKAARTCVGDVSQTSLTTTAMVTLGTYDIERSQFPVSLVVSAPGPPFSASGALEVDLESAKRIREKASVHPAHIRYRLVCSVAEASPGASFAALAGIERFGVAIEEAFLSDSSLRSLRPLTLSPETHSKEK